MSNSLNELNDFLSKHPPKGKTEGKPVELPPELEHHRKAFQELKDIQFAMKSDPKFKELLYTSAIAVTTAFKVIDKNQENQLEAFQIAEVIAGIIATFIAQKSLILVVKRPSTDGGKPVENPA